MNIDELFIDANNLPRPLSKKQTYELLDKINDGDKQALEMLSKHNVRLVLSEVTRKFKLIEYDKKELVAIGNVGLVNAIKTFDKSKNIEFSTYAVRCIDNQILMFLRKIKKHNNVDSLDKIISYNKDGEELKLKDTIYDKVNFTEEYEKEEIYQIIQEIVKELPYIEKRIITLRFGFDNNKIHTQREIADIISISQAQVSRLIEKITKKIELKLKENGIEEHKIKKRSRVVKSKSCELDITITKYEDDLKTNQMILTVKKKRFRPCASAHKFLRIKR